MVFVFSEDGSLEVIETNELAQRYEPLDVESRVSVSYTHLTLPTILRV